MEMVVVTFAAAEEHTGSAPVEAAAHTGFVVAALAAHTVFEPAAVAGEPASKVVAVERSCSSCSCLLALMRDAGRNAIDEARSRRELAALGMETVAAVAALRAEQEVGSGLGSCSAASCSS